MVVACAYEVMYEHSPGQRDSRRAACRGLAIAWA